MVSHVLAGLAGLDGDVFLGSHHTIYVIYFDDSRTSSVHMFEC